MRRLAQWRDERLHLVDVGEARRHRPAAVASPSPAKMAPVGPDGIPLYYVALITRAPATGRPDAHASVNV